MRDYRFRGKRIDNGEWVEGDLLRYGDGSCYICPIDGVLLKARRVHPKTVGQFTGLNDRNGKAIFEGDRLRCVSENHSGEVRFSGGSFVTNAAGWGDDSFAHLDCDDFEIIGTIHDKEQPEG